MTKRVWRVDPAKKRKLLHKSEQRSHEQEKQLFGIDLKKLQASPNANLILRLMTIQNDISVIPYLSKLIAADLASKPEQKFYYSSLQWYLMRLRQSAGAEAVRQTMVQIKTQEKMNGSHLKPIWELINENSHVKDYFREIEDYLPKHKGGLFSAGKHYAELQKSLTIRDEQTAHYDVDKMDEYLAAYVNVLEENKSSTVDWISDTTSELPPRCLVADSVMAIGWKIEHGIPIDAEQGKPNSETAKVAEHLDRFLGACANFSAELIKAYINKHELYLPNAMPDFSN